MTRNHALRVALCLLVFAAGFLAGGSGSSTARAQSVEKYYVDASWGPLRGSLGGRILLFEDADGTVRFVDISKFDLMTRELQVERVLERK